MAKTIYVANLPEDVTRDSVRELFSAYGEVESVTLLLDKDLNPTNDDISNPNLSIFVRNYGQTVTRFQCRIHARSCIVHIVWHV